MTHYFGLACIVVYLVALCCVTYRAFFCPKDKWSIRFDSENHKFSDEDGE